MKKLFLAASLVFAGLFSQLSAASIGENIQLFGFASQGYFRSFHNNYLIHDSKEGWGTFNMTEAALTTYISASDNLRIGMQLFAYELGNFGKSKMRIDWAYGDYHVNDAFGIRLGKIKAPGGLYTQTWDIDIARVPILLPQSVYWDPVKSQLMTVFGLDLYGNIDLKSAGDIEYEIEFGANVIDVEQVLFTEVKENAKKSIEQSYARANTALKGTEARVESFANEKFNYYYQTASQAAYNTPFGLKAGVNFRSYYFDQKSDLEVTLLSNEYSGGALSNQKVYFHKIKTLTESSSPFALTFFAEYMLGNLILSGEYSLRRTKLIIKNSDSPVEIIDDHTSEGWYGMASYRFTDWLVLGAYYSSYIVDISDRDGTGAVVNPYSSVTQDWQTWQRDAALTVRFDITDSWIFKLEGHYVNGTGLVAWYNDGKVRQHWGYMAAKTTFHF